VTRSEVGQEAMVESALEARFDAKLDALTRQVAQLSERVAALEQAPPRRAPGVPRRAGPLEAPALAPVADAPDAVTVQAGFALVGRTLLVLAGAFVLRALSDSGSLPVAAGAALGLAYAGACLVLADGAAARGVRASATAHGVAAALIGFPLLVEAMAKFQLLGLGAGVALLALLSAAALGVAARRRLEGLAWVAGLGSLGAALALMPATGRLVPSTLLLVLLGAGAAWLRDLRGWRGLRWPVAAAADLSALALVVRAAAPGATEGPGQALLVLVTLLAVSLVGPAARALTVRRGAEPFELAQVAAAIALAAGGATFLEARGGLGVAGLGAACLAAGAVAYAAAAVLLRRGGAGRLDLVYSAWVALALSLAGTTLLLAGGALAAALAVLALAAALGAWRTAQPLLAAHAAAYAVASAAAGGLLALASQATLGLPGAGWAPAGWAEGALVAALAAVAWMAGQGGERAARWARLAHLALLATLAAAAAGLVLGRLVPLVAGRPGGDANPGAAAAARTAVLAAAAVLLAWAGRLPAWREAGLLAYPVLGLLGVKVLLEDLRLGRPATLILGFACYGLALILTPRLRPLGRQSPAAAHGGGGAARPGDAA